MMSSFPLRWYGIIDNKKNLEVLNIFNSSFNTVPDGQALLGTRTSAGTVVTKSGSRIYTHGKHLKGYEEKDYIVKPLI